VLLSLVAVVVFLFATVAENRWFEKKVAYRTLVARGEGLREGLPILLSGIEIGEVGSMVLLNDNRLEVELLVREQHAGRVKQGSRAQLRRILGIGEKQIHLEIPDPQAPVLSPGAFLPADELADLLDTISNVDVARYLTTLDRAVASMEIVTTKLEEDDRLSRMMEAFDEVGPTMSTMNRLLGRIEEPLAEVLEDKSVRRTFQGADKLFNDPNTRRVMGAVSNTMEAERRTQLIDRMQRVFAQLETQLSDSGHINRTFVAADNVLHDKRMNAFVEQLGRMSESKKLEKLVDNMSLIAHELAKIGPEMPQMSKEFVRTMNEAVIVLRALQKTWLLKDESAEAKKGLEKK
jgi:broad specificity phosphatase PhoE